MIAKVKWYAVLLSNGLKSEVADSVAKIKLFVKSSFEEQLVATRLSKSLIGNIEKL